MSALFSFGSEGSLPAADVSLLRPASWTGEHHYNDFHTGEYAYPGPRPVGSFVLRDEFVRGLDFSDGGWVERESGSPVSLEGKVLVLAYGSNADPKKLADKLEGFEVIGLRCITLEHASVWTVGHRGDGFRPATIAPSAGVYELHHVLAVDPEAIEKIDEVEGVSGGWYRSEPCDYVLLENGVRPPNVSVYVGARERTPVFVEGNMARVAHWSHAAIESAAR